MGEPGSVQVGKHLQGGTKHVFGLGSRERPVGQNLRKILFRKLGHNIKHGSIAQLTAAPMQEANQVRVRKPGSALPSRELQLRAGRVRVDELDGGFLCGRSVEGKENCAMVRATLKLAESEASIDNSSLPLFPGFAHRDTRHGSFPLRFYALGAEPWGRAQK